MQNNPKKQEKTALEKVIEITRAELNQLSQGPVDDGFVMSENQSLIKFINSDKLFNLRHEHAWSALMDDIKVEPEDIAKHLGWLLEDLTRNYLPHEDKETFIHYHKLLTNIKHFFTEILYKEESKKIQDHFNRTLYKEMKFK